MLTGPHPRSPAVATGNCADIWLHMVATFGGAAPASLYNRWFILSIDKVDNEAESTRGRRGSRRGQRDQ